MSALKATDSFFLWLYVMLGRSYDSDDGDTRYPYGKYRPRRSFYLLSYYEFEYALRPLFIGVILVIYTSLDVTSWNTKDAHLTDNSS